MKFDLQPRDGALTCAYCLTELGEEPWSCKGCGVHLHRECSREVARCPTVGCGAEVAEDPPVLISILEDSAEELGSPRAQPRRLSESAEEGTQQAALMACAMLGGLPGMLAGVSLYSYVEEVGRSLRWSHESRAAIVVAVVSVVWVLGGIGIALLMNRFTGYPKRI